MPDESLADLKYIFDRVDAQIRLELDLIGQRITALCISQSFWVAAYVNVVRISDTEGKVFLHYRSCLMAALPLLGLLSALILGRAMQAADHVIQQRKQERERIRGFLRARLNAGGVEPADVLGEVSPTAREHQLGQAVIWIAWIIVGFWVLALGMYAWQLLAGW